MKMKVALAAVAALLCMAAPAAKKPGIVTYEEWSADMDWKALEEMRWTPGKYQSLPWNEYFRYEEARNRHMSDAHLAFYRTYTADPRRWEAALLFLQLAPQFWDLDYQPPASLPEGTGLNVPIDRSYKERWEQQAEELRRTIRTGTDVPLSAKQGLDAMDVKSAIQATHAALLAGQPVDWTALRAQVDAHIARYSTVPGTSRIAGEYMVYFQLARPDDVEREWASFLKSPNAQVREMAEGKKRFAELAKAPLDIRFTALDGREVDLTQLRGKIVLVDFWATWCGPCVAEIPNIRAVYEKYRNQGFEVIGISADRAPGAAGPKKGAKTREEVRAFLKQYEVSWPQYYDGKGQKNAFSVKYEVDAYPTTLLLDRTGKVTSLSARGEKLEPQVRALLEQRQ